jgi:molecular chaperone DnaK
MGIIVGIDLGTTNSNIARLDDTGRPVMIENTNSSESPNITPSVVAFEGANVLVGESAKEVAHLNPDGAVFEKWKLKMQDPQAITKGGVTKTPVELSSLVLKELVAAAEQKTGQSVESAVITIPAKFEEEARRNTIAAGEAIGLKIKDIINEPTAALLYYSLSHQIVGKVIVFDFGGGTLDVTAAEVQGQDIRVICSNGDNVGGQNFDDAVQNLIVSAFEKETGEKFDRAIHSLGASPETYKKRLSAKSEVQAQVTGGKAGRTVITITRESFEKATAMLLARANMLLENTMDEARLALGDITDVYLVGGSTRMPMVVTLLTDYFKKAPVALVNPDEAVSLGAALYAGLKAAPALLNPAQREAVKQVQLQEVANHYYGTISLTELSGGIKALRVSNVIKKNTPIPHTEEQTYYTINAGQTAVEVVVTQSAIDEDDPDFVRIIWTGELGPFPEGRPAQQPILVKYSYDANQVMHCTFTDVGTGLTKEVDLSFADSKSSKSSFDVE